MINGLEKKYHKVVDSPLQKFSTNWNKNFEQKIFRYFNTTNFEILHRLFYV